MLRMRRLFLLCPLLGLVFVFVARAQVAIEYAPPSTVSVLPPNPHAAEPGLLFYLSGDHSLNADYAAGGNPVPNYVKDVKILPGGVHGSYIQCGNNQLLSYWAPGNIYSQRGTLSFFWRSRMPVDETEFPVFRVGFADHSSWDMVWLRIDYNGHGFDAFVTDVNLGRTRVSVTMPNFPKPDEWIHLALAWDETSGIRFYVNGKLAATKAATGLFDTDLDQFGPHSRIIGPTGVESSYSYDRGGDLDELRIYDRALSDDNIASLAKNEIPQNIPAIDRAVAAGAAASASGPGAPVVPAEGRYDSGSGHATDWQTEWNLKYGWNRPGDSPVLIDSSSPPFARSRFTMCYDLDRWWWKATDGIRETTWPGVYNRSRLIGRDDYYELPDWDCYSLSGKAVTFDMPDEPWNHLEIAGGAWGNMSLLAHSIWRRARTPTQRSSSAPAARRSPTTNSTSRFQAAKNFASPTSSRSSPSASSPPITFTPAWSPLASPHCATGSPAKSRPTTIPPPSRSSTFIAGRFPADERMTMMAMPAGRSSERRERARNPALPIVHIIIPADFRSQMVRCRATAHPTAGRIWTAASTASPSICPR